MFKKEYYENFWGKKREFRKQQSLQESGNRRQYFSEIEMALHQDIESIIGPIEDMEIIGSVSSNAAETGSDIDILIKPKKRQKELEFKHDLHDKTSNRTALIYLYTALNATGEVPYQIELFTQVENTNNDIVPPAFRHAGKIEQIEKRWKQKWDPTIRCIY